MSMPNKPAVSDLSERWARGIFERDPDATKRVRALIAEWNARNPDSKIEIKLSNIQRRVKEMRLTAAARFAKSLPKEMRDKAPESES